MQIPPQIRPTDAAPFAPALPRPASPIALLYKMRGGIMLLRVLALCAHTAAYAQPATSLVTPEQKFSPGYLEAVSSGYENGQPAAPVEGLAPVRPTRAERAESAPAAPAAPAPATRPSSILAHPPGSLRRVTAH